LLFFAGRPGPFGIGSHRREASTHAGLIDITSRADILNTFTVRVMMTAVALRGYGAVQFAA
jgi:hypothetical protein